LVEGGRCSVPESAPWLDDWLTEHERFPFGAHDDQVDTTSMALTRFGLGRKSGYWTA
jgi:predicted phage terminase large subunit-like protein